MTHYDKRPSLTPESAWTAGAICLTWCLAGVPRAAPQLPTDTTLQVQRAKLVSRPRSSLISTVHTMTLRPR